MCTYDKFELCKRVFANREKFAFNFLCEEKNLELVDIALGKVCGYYESDVCSLI